MSIRCFLALTGLSLCTMAGAETEIYLGLGESIVPLDGASATQTIEAGQFLDAFRGTRFYFRVREGYEGELVSLGTPRAPMTAGGTQAVAAEASMASDAASAGQAEKEVPNVLGPFEIAGIYIYDSETGMDRGVDCERATMRRLDQRTFEFICPQTMEL